MSKFQTICYGMFPVCHISNEMQKHLYNAKYDCPCEDAVIFSLLLVGTTKLSFQYYSLDIYFLVWACFHQKVSR